MKIERALKIRDRAKTRIYDSYHLGRISRLTSERINSYVINIKSEMPKGTPQWVKSFIDGMVEVLNSDLYFNHLEFCYMVDGKLLSVNKDSKRHYSKAKITPKQLHDRATLSGHYWRDSDRPYYVGKV